MNMPLVPGAGPLARLLPGHRAEEDARIRQAAWVARCVGRGEAAPLRPDDVTALAGMLQVREFTPGQVAFKAGEAAAGVWIVRGGPGALAVGSVDRIIPAMALRPYLIDAIGRGLARDLSAEASERAVSLRLASKSLTRPSGASGG